MYINTKSVFLLLVIYNYCYISYLFIVLFMHCNEAQYETEIPNEHPAPRSEQAPTACICGWWLSSFWSLQADAHLSLENAVIFSLEASWKQLSARVTAPKITNMVRFYFLISYYAVTLYLKELYPRQLAGQRVIPREVTVGGFSRHLHVL